MGNFSGVCSLYASDLLIGGLWKIRLAQDEILIFTWKEVIFSRLNNTKHDYLLFSNLFFLINTVKPEADRGFPKRGVQAEKGSEHTESMCASCLVGPGACTRESVGEMEPLGASKRGVWTPLWIYLCKQCDIYDVYDYEPVYLGWIPQNFYC